jgi:hypothetical protein
LSGPPLSSVPTDMHMPYCIRMRIRELKDGKKYLSKHPGITNINVVH